MYRIHSKEVCVAYLIPVEEVVLVLIQDTEQLVQLLYNILRVVRLFLQKYSHTFNTSLEGLSKANGRVVRSTRRSDVPVVKTYDVKGNWSAQADYLHG